MSLRILHVDTARGWRGGQNQVLLAAQGMAARGHEVILACREGGALEARARAAGLVVMGLPFRGDLWPPAVATLARVLRATRPRAAQLHDPHAVSAGLLARGFARGTALVATRRVDFPLRGALSRAKYRACDRVVAASQAILSVLEGGGIPKAKLRLVYEGVPERLPAPGGGELLRALGVPEGAPVIGNVAALTQHKDHETLLRAAALVRARRAEVRFLVVGEGERRAALERLSVELALEGTLIFTGFRSDLDLLFPAFTIFCLSSRLEGLGTSLLDAMALGLPIVATRAGGIPEAVEEGVTGRLVPPGEPQALAAALLELLADEPRRRAMGEAGRCRFRERFTSERMVEETLGVLAELA